MIDIGNFVESNYFHFKIKVDLSKKKREIGKYLILFVSMTNFETKKLEE